MLFNGNSSGANIGLECSKAVITVLPQLHLKCSEMRFAVYLNFPIVMAQGDNMPEHAA